MLMVDNNVEGNEENKIHRLICYCNNFIITFYTPWQWLSTLPLIWETGYPSKEEVKIK